MARFLIDGPVLPLITDTIRVAESFRAAVMSRFEGWCRQHPDVSLSYRRSDDPERFASPTLAGKDRNGEMLVSHDHAYYLPTAEGTDPQRVSHVTLFAEGGYGAVEIAALQSLRKLTLGEGEPLQVMLPVGLGKQERTSPASLLRLPRLAGVGDGRSHQPPGTSSSADNERIRLSWEVATNELDSLSSFSKRSLPAGVSSARSCPDPCASNRWRRTEWARPASCPCSSSAFETEKAMMEAVVLRERSVSSSRPPCPDRSVLGHACHFGLGLFLPESVGIP